MRLHVLPWTLEGLDLGASLLELGPGYGASTELLLPRCEALTSVEYDPRLADSLRNRMQAQVREAAQAQAPEESRVREAAQAPEELRAQMRRAVQEQASEGLGKRSHPERSEGPAVSRPATNMASPSPKPASTQAHPAKISVLHGDAADLDLPASAFDSAVCFMMLHHVIPAPRQDRLFAEAFRVLRPGGLFAGADSPASPLLSLLHLGDKVVMVDPASLPNRLQAAGFKDVQVNQTRYAFRFRARKPAAAI